MTVFNFTLEVLSCTYYGENQRKNQSPTLRKSVKMASITPKKNRYERQVVYQTSFFKFCVHRIKKKNSPDSKYSTQQK